MPNEHVCDIGIVGLGVMGRSLALNFADHEFAVAGYDIDPARVKSLAAEANGRSLFAVDALATLARALRPPRPVLLLVPAGAPVDEAIAGLAPHLEPGDIIIDGGNSFFRDTDARAQALAGRGIHYIGLGISGGEHGARHGPSLMPGGPREAYQRVHEMFEAVAARAEGVPAVAYLGPGSAGHYVKMVHNGIEYALMRLIAETYDFMKWGLALTNEELGHIYRLWNESELNSYLLEITAKIFQRVDDKTGRPLIDMILDEAEQKGTGRWAAEDAMELGVPTPTISISVAMRDMSRLKAERVAAFDVLTGPERLYHGDVNRMLNQLRNALYASMAIVFAQGMAQLRAASSAYGYGLRLDDVARTWSAGSIIRTALLKKIRLGYRASSDLPNLLVDRQVGFEVMARQVDLRAVVRTAASLGISVPAFATSLSYYDAYRSAWSPANLIEAQRDYFGAHSYERTDARGTFHTRWESDEEGGSLA